MRALWIALNVLFLAMFLFSVAVQFNDPDPVRWVAIYGFAAIACIGELTRNERWSLPAGIGDLFAEFEMKNEMIEEAREAGGLLIVALWMAILAVSAFRRGRKNNPLQSQPAQHA